MKKKLCLFSLLFFAYSVSGIETDTGMSVSNVISDSASSSKSAQYNPFAITGVSLLIPGAGQFYTRHYVKGGTFLALEAITGSVAVYWWNNSKVIRQDTKAFEKSALLKTGVDSLRALRSAELSRHNELFSRYRAYNAMTWALTGYLYNAFDAIECSNIIDKSGERNPMIAGWLSAIPGLALGQWYNGSVSKAGLYMMGQVSLGMVAYNYHRLMKDAEQGYKRVYNAGGDSISVKLRNEFSKQWDSQRRDAFKSRNTYLWYSIFLYFIGVFDAVVDAHLHDYPEKMNMYPDLVPQNSGAQLRLNVKF